MPQRFAAFGLEPQKFGEGSEILEVADDLITTDFTSDMIQSIVSEYIERRTAVATVTETVEEAEYSLARSE